MQEADVCLKQETLLYLPAVPELMAINKKKPAAKEHFPTLSFVKWAGGKTQLLEQLKPLFPSKISRYFEPFVGSGAVFFYVMRKYQPKEAFISDINGELISAYEAIRDDVLGLIARLKEHKRRHMKSMRSGAKKQSNYYYHIRAQDPKELSKLDVAARFIYLNKTCFNGLYRVNSKGKFNVPMGRYKKPAIFNESRLLEASDLLKGVTIRKIDFREIINFAKEGDFVYFDPPYYPLENKKSFTSYTKDTFLEKEQEDLQKVYGELDRRGCKLMLSNSDTEFIKELYKQYKINSVRARRMINCNGSARGPVTEVVITNYYLVHMKYLKYLKYYSKLNLPENSEPVSLG